jgi:DtxR family Mn-dependent transcriptional regulator
MDLHSAECPDEKIDTVSRYLRILYELDEEGIDPLRARVVERTGHAGTTVIRTVARMERDGLVHLARDRTILFTVTGRSQATAVMRKHRVVERLLVDVIGLAREQAHLEANRWQHVISDEAERHIVGLLSEPWVCPHGKPIPGLDDLGIIVPESSCTA